MYLFSFLPILSQWHRLGQEELYSCLHGLEVHVCTMIPNKEFSTVTFSIMFGLPCLLMGFCYAQIYRTAMAHKERMSTMTLGSYTSDKSAPLSPAKATCDEVVSLSNFQFLLPVDRRHSGKKQFAYADSITSKVTNSMQPCLKHPIVLESSLTSDLFLNYKMFYPKLELLSRRRKWDESQSKSISCPDLITPQSDWPSNPFHEWSSLCQISKFKSHSFLVCSPSDDAAAKSTAADICTSLKNSTSKCDVAFSIAPSVDQETIIGSTYGDISECDYHIEPIFEPVLCARLQKTRTREETVHLKQILRLSADDKESSMFFASKNGKLVERIEKNKEKRKEHHLKAQKHGFLGEDFRTARSISFIIICFAVTWCPYWVTMLIMPYLGPGKVPDPIIGACLWLAYVGSALNPFVYYFSNKSVKRGIKKRLIKLLQSRR